jgi:hypothetical protein
MTAGTSRPRTIAQGASVQTENEQARTWDSLPRVFVFFGCLYAALDLDDASGEY